MLEDTLVGFQLPPFRQMRKRKPLATAKFYFFNEVKCGRRVSAADLKGLMALSEEVRLKKRLVVSRESHARTTE